MTAPLEALSRGEGGLAVNNTNTNTRNNTDGTVGKSATTTTTTTASDDDEDEDEDDVLPPPTIDAYATTHIRSGTKAKGKGKGKGKGMDSDDDDDDDDEVSRSSALMSFTKSRSRSVVRGVDSGNGGGGAASDSDSKESEEQGASPAVDNQPTFPQSTKSNNNNNNKDDKHNNTSTAAAASCNSPSSQFTDDVPQPLIILPPSALPAPAPILTSFLSAIPRVMAQKYYPRASGPMVHRVAAAYVSQLTQQLIVLAEPMQHALLRRSRAAGAKQHNEAVELLYGRLDTVCKRYADVQDRSRRLEQQLDSQQQANTLLLEEVEQRRLELDAAVEQNTLLKHDLTRAVCVKETALLTLRDEVAFYEKENMQWSDRLAQLGARNRDLVRQNELQMVEITHLRSQNTPGCCTIM
jgi:hypothetical protein